MDVEEEKPRIIEEISIPLRYGRLHRTAAIDGEGALPVMSDEASEARNRIAPIRSSTAPRRPRGDAGKVLARNAGFAKNGSVIGVRRKVGPGVTWNVVPSEAGRG
jgi:hypothetical protein